MARIRCSYCQNEIFGHYLRCTDCVEFDFCLRCFSLGAEIATHRREHSFTIKNDQGPCIFEDSDRWSLAEENMLLDAVEQYGFGNWSGAAAHIETRTTTECEEHYKRFYINGIIGDATLQEVPRPSITDHTSTNGVRCENQDDPCAKYIPTQQRQKRSALLGGENAVETDDVMVQEAAHWAMQHINKMSNSMFMQGLLKISDPTKQIVNGVKYHFGMTTVFTSCRNTPENHQKTLQECPVSKSPKPQDCDVHVIYSQGKYSMQNFKCEARKSPIGGGDHDYIPHGHDYIPHGKDTVKHFSILGGDTHDYLPHGDAKCAEHVPAFIEFKNKYKRVYGSNEMEAQRFKIFCENMEKVKAIQSVEQGTATYGATKFADISEEEFKKQYLGFKPPASPKRQWPKAVIPEGPIPESWDWRDHNAVTPVKNQGWYGSCWAFSTTGNVEGQWAVNSPAHNLVSFSEQELVDCDKIDQGCNGGFMYDAYEAIMELGGLETESEYKYTGKDGKCAFNRSEVVAKVTGAVNISKDEGEMAAWLYKNGPIAIGINSFPMQFYIGGIAHPWKFFCDPNALDHGVLIVGYGKQGKKPYWIIKNSWGANWGRRGYYYIYRGDGSCGLNTMCSSATVN